MNIPKNVCWNITCRCNANCRFCYRTEAVAELSGSKNKEIIRKLFESGVSEITWTGGEALLYDNLEELLAYAYSLGIKNHLISNTILLTEERMNAIVPLLDTITVSLDSCDDDINRRIGRGESQFSRVKKVIDYLNEKHPKVTIKVNTLLSRYTLKNIVALSDFVFMMNIEKWRLFRFIDLRGTAVYNKNEFQLLDSEYTDIKDLISKRSFALQYFGTIEFVGHEEIEKDYLLLTPDGNVIVTRNKKDIVLGNALYEELEMILSRLD